MTYGALIMSLDSVNGSGSGNLGNEAQTVSDLIDRLCLAGELLAALGAVYDLIVGAFLSAGCGNDVLLYSLAGSMRELIDGLGLARDLFTALR